MKNNGWITLFIVCGLVLGSCNLPQPVPPTPTHTPGPSPTRTATPTLTPTPTIPPTATPQPQIHIAKGQSALFVGDYFTARDEFQEALVSPDAVVQAQAHWGLARTEFSAGNYSIALNNLRIITEQYPDSEFHVIAWCLLGETYFTLGRYEEAAAAYQTYQEKRPGVLDAFIQTRRGDALSASGKTLDAIGAYETALLAGATDQEGIKLQLGQAYAAAGDPSKALTIYDEISASTKSDYVQAQIDLLAGQAHLKLGDANSAYGRWRHAVESYPLSYDSYMALLGLVDAGQEVNEFDRGLVDYFAKQYGVALAAFARYLDQNPGHDGTVLHYLALTYREMGEYNSAIKVWDDLIQKYPENPYWAAAWDEQSTTYLLYKNDPEKAAQTLLDFVGKQPDSIYAPTYMMDAARIYERMGKLDEAAKQWETLAGKYPTSTVAGEALFQAGLTYYRLGNFDRAREDFERSYPLMSTSTDRARVKLWVGKSFQKAGKEKEATEAFKSAQTQDPTEYYSLRARDILIRREPFQAPPSYRTEYDLKAERAEANTWVMIKFKLPPESNLNDLGSLKEYPAFLRGQEFWSMGMFDQARVEFEDLREAISNDPARSYILGNYLLDIGLYRPAIFCIRQVLSLAGLDEHNESLGAPAYFKHVRYGLYYRDLIFPAAEENELDPLLIMSLVRQESLFEGFVRSSANAHGLMQIIPSTGEGIAAQMGWPPNYTKDLLYSPYVSVRMGTYYLASNRQFLDGDLFAALAAYNGGPGNAQTWKNISGGDPDLFLEVVRFQETRNYIRAIYEIYDIYRSTYSPME